MIADQHSKVGTRSKRPRARQTAAPRRKMDHRLALVISAVPGDFCATMPTLSRASYRSPLPSAEVSLGSFNAQRRPLSTRPKRPNSKRMSSLQVVLPLVHDAQACTMLRSAQVIDDAVYGVRLSFPSPQNSPRLSRRSARCVLASWALSETRTDESEGTCFVDNEDSGTEMSGVY